MTPKVSVVIPVFNKASWIEETLMSVADQTYKDWEAIIVDDGSTDDSLKIIRNFIKQTPGEWKVISQENRGQCEARNAGINASSGEFIALLDGDDCWAENKLEIQVAMLVKNQKAALVLCPYLIYDDSKSKFGQRLVMHKNTKKMLEGWLSLRGFGGGTESTGLIRKTELISAGGFDPKLSTSAGLDLTLRLSRLGEILFANNTCMKYRIHTGQWHTNLEVLEADLVTLRGGLPASLQNHLSQIESRHSAYLRLQELRQSRSAKGKNARNSSFISLLILVYSIIARHLVARARAIFPKFLTKIPVAYLRESSSR